MSGAQKNAPGHGIGGRETLSQAIARLEGSPKAKFSDTPQTVDEINATNGYLNGYIAAKTEAMKIIRAQQRMIGEAEISLLRALNGKQEVFEAVNEALKQLESDGVE